MYPSGSPSPTVATIDLSALAYNLTQVRSLLADTCQILAVVKADAYGHGAVAISRTLMGLGITRFGVSTVQEGILLREAGFRGSVLVLGAVFPNQIPDLFGHGLTPVVYDPDMALKLSQL
ncbi:MAG: alanine racemase, partial [Nitrospiraceae bacterium]